MKLKRNTNLKNKSMTTVLFLSLLLSFLWVKDKPYSDFKKAVYIAAATGFGVLLFILSILTLGMIALSLISNIL